MLGRTFERWGIVSQAENNKHGQKMWLCHCSCGTERAVTGNALRRGGSKSCGCLQKEAASLTGRANRGRFVKTAREVISNEIFAAYVNRAAKRNREWGLTREEFDSLVQSRCFYCQSSPSEHPKRTKRRDTQVGFNGIDRWDNNQGYIVGNVVSCCSVCNDMKGTMSGEDFIRQVSRIQIARRGMAASV